MSLMITGLALFFAVHLVPWSVRLRDATISRLGLNGYKMAFTVVALIGLVLTVIGKGRAGFEPLYDPAPAMQHLTRLLVLVGFVLLPAAHMKTNIKRFTRHPMLWGIVLWGVGHLLANGDRASVVLFGAFVVYSLAAMVSANARGATKSTSVFPIRNDLIVVAAGVSVYIVLMLAHGVLFGYPLL